MKKIYRLSLLLLLSSFFILQLAQGVLPNSKTITNNGLITPSTEPIIFEYGAEGGIVGKEPEGAYGPFDWAGASGGPVEDGYAKITDVKARTGTKSVKFYQPPPYKSDGDRRITLRKNYGSEHEQYLSYWVWYPDEIVDNTCWRNLGGLKIRYETSPNENDRARNGISIHLTGSSQLLLKVYNLYCPVRKSSSGSLGEDGTYTEVHSGVYLNSSYRNTWIQMQLYIKVSNNTDGGYKFWLNGNEIVSVMGYKTDPRCRGDWTSEGWYYQYSDDGTPYVSITIYNGRNEPEVWCWVDDIVVSREYVPDTYGVNG